MRAQRSSSGIPAGLPNVSAAKTARGFSSSSWAIDSRSTLRVLGGPQTEVWPQRPRLGGHKAKRGDHDFVSGSKGGQHQWETSSAGRTRDPTVSLGEFGDRFGEVFDPRPAGQYGGLQHVQYRLPFGFAQTKEWRCSSTFSPQSTSTHPVDQEPHGDFFLLGERVGGLVELQSLGDEATRRGRWRTLSTELVGNFGPRQCGEVTQQIGRNPSSQGDASVPASRSSWRGMFKASHTALTTSAGRTGRGAAAAPSVRGSIANRWLRPCLRAGPLHRGG